MTSDTTPRLGLPWLMPAQAQKHVTLNEALGRLDALVQAVALSRAVTDQPADPSEGDAYILPANPTGTAWSGFAAEDLVYFQDGAWARIAPRPGLCVYVLDEPGFFVSDGAVWAASSALIQSLSGLAAFGLGTAPDANNAFAVKSNAALWTALEGWAGGTGDLRCTFNKEAAGNTVSVLFQSAWSARAEIGLAGDEDLVIKVSADGASWTEAVRVNRTSGAVQLGNVTIKSDTIHLPNLPTSISGLATGDLWSDGGIVKIAP